MELTQLQGQALVKAETLKQRLEVEILEEVGLIKSHIAFGKKIVRINTKETYVPVFEG